MLDNEKTISYPYSSDSREFYPMNHFRTGCLFRKAIKMRELRWLCGEPAWR